MDTPGGRAPDEDAVDHAAGHWTPCQHHGGACHRPSPKSDAATEAVVLSPRLDPSCASSASLSFFLFLWKGNVSADEGDGRENKRLRPTYSAAVPRRATPWTPFGFSIKMEKKLVQEPGAVPSAIHAAADACHHHHGNRRGKSAGCGHVGRRLADQQLGARG